MVANRLHVHVASPPLIAKHLRQKSPETEITEITIYTTGMVPKSISSFLLSHLLGSSYFFFFFFKCVKHHDLCLGLCQLGMIH